MSSVYQSWMEYDYNPFMLFGKRGETLFANRAAELLLGFVPARTFYDLAKSHLAADTAVRTHFTPYNYDKFHFYALTVGEQNEAVGLKLYQSPISMAGDHKKLQRQQRTNIYLVLDASLSLAKTRNPGCHFDPTLPKFKLDQNQFAKVLRHLFERCKESKHIHTALQLKTGEFLKMDGQRYPLVQYTIECDNCHSGSESTIRELAEPLMIHCHFEKNRVELDIPMVN